MKACTVYRFSEEGPDKSRNINEKGPNERKGFRTLLENLDICFHLMEKASEGQNLRVHIEKIHQSNNRHVLP